MAYADDNDYQNAVIHASRARDLLEKLGEPVHEATAAQPGRSDITGITTHPTRGTSPQTSDTGWSPCVSYCVTDKADGTTEALHNLLRGKVRIASERESAPHGRDHRLAKRENILHVAESSQGIDAGKKIKGRERHIATDVLGLLLAVMVTAVSVQDSAGAKQVLDRIAEGHPSMSIAWVDGGYNETVIRHGIQRGIHVEVVKRPTAKGFHVLPRRWVVERTLGWLMQHRRLARDYEALPQRSRTMIHWAHTVDRLTQDRIS